MRNAKEIYITKYNQILTEKGWQNALVSLLANITIVEFQQGLEDILFDVNIETELETQKCVTKLANDVNNFCDEILTEIGEINGVTPSTNAWKKYVESEMSDVYAGIVWS